MATNTKQAWARGGLIFAATLMLLVGVYEFFVGIAAIAHDELIVAGPLYYYTVDVTAWGWIHLILGALAAITGFFLYTGASWARFVGIALCVLSATANFFLLPYYPVWSLLLIGLNVFAIWAIATARGRNEFAPESSYESMGYEQREQTQTMQAQGYGPAQGQQYAGQQPGMAPGTYAGDTGQTAQRWPQENPSSGRHWAPQDVKEGANQAADEAQQQAQHASQSAGVQPPRPPDYNPPQ